MHAPAKATTARCVPEVWQGLPCHRLHLPSGDQLLVAEHGAQVLSWQAGGQERLYLSPRSRFDGLSPIRGGIPLCWPQFNQRGPLPKHGFARHLPWQPVAARVVAEGIEIDLQLRDTPQTLSLWPHAFVATLTVSLQPRRLRVTLALHNPGAQPWAFSGALHTYLALQDVAQAQLQGLQQRPEWDAVADVHGTALEALHFGPEFDRVYGGRAQAMTLQDGAHTLRISQSDHWGQTVVWNPGAALCQTLADMPADGHRHMLCVEAAQVYDSITVPAAGQWQAWQELQAL